MTLECSSKCHLPESAHLSVIYLIHQNIWLQSSTGEIQSCESSPCPHLSKDTVIPFEAHMQTHTNRMHTRAHTLTRAFHFNPRYPFEKRSKFHIDVYSSWMFASDIPAALLNVPPNGQLWVIWKDAPACGQQAAPGRQLKDKTIHYY